jgi:hypothetical protein
LEAAVDSRVDERFAKKYAELEKLYQEREAVWKEDNEITHAHVRYLSDTTQHQQAELSDKQERADKVFVGQLQYAFKLHVLALLAFPPEIALPPKTFGQAVKLFKGSWAGLTTDVARSVELEASRLQLKAQLKVYRDNNINMYNQMALEELKNIRNPEAHPKIDLLQVRGFAAMEDAIKRVFEPAKVPHIKDIAVKLYQLQKQVGIVKYT